MRFSNAPGYGVCVFNLIYCNFYFDFFIGYLNMNSDGFMERPWPRVEQHWTSVC